MRRTAGITASAGIGCTAGFFAGVWVAYATDGQDGLERGTMYGVIGAAAGGMAGVVIAL